LACVSRWNCDVKPSENEQFALKPLAVAIFYQKRQVKQSTNLRQGQKIRAHITLVAHLYPHFLK